MTKTIHAPLVTKSVLTIIFWRTKTEIILVHLVIMAAMTFCNDNPEVREFTEEQERL